MVSSPGFLRSLDPRTKIIIASAFSLFVFFMDSLAVSAAQLIILTSAALCSGIPLKKLFPRIKFLIYMVSMILLMQMLFRYDPNGIYLLKPLIPQVVPLIGGKGSLSLSGFFAGIAICCRVFSITALMSVLVATTDVRLIALGITKLGAPYKAAYVITSALNLVRTFEDEARLIMDARKLRGAAPRSFAERLNEYRAIAMPLMVKVMRGSIAVSLVMDSRAFGAYKTRTWLISIKMTARDYIALFAGLVFYVTSIIADRFTEGLFFGA